jgi:SAM-dependent methyltransferase
MAANLYEWCRSAYHRLYALQLRFACAVLGIIEKAEFTRKNDDPPTPPPVLRFRVNETFRTSVHQKTGRELTDRLEASLHSYGSPLLPGMRVLDFGCGSGRVLSWLVKRHPSTAFFGSDVDHEAIEWCSANLSPAEFSVNSEFPPLDFSSDHFDIIYGISVYTHFDQAHQVPWLKELYRILKPGGVLLLTLHGPTALSTTTLSSAETGILDRTGILFRTSGKHAGIQPAWYHTSFTLSSYTLRLFAEQGLIQTVYQEQAFGYQDAIIGRKTKTASARIS